MWLPNGEKMSKISSFVLAQLINLTDARTDRRTPGDGIYRAYAYASRGKNHFLKFGSLHPCVLGNLLIISNRRLTKGVVQKICQIFIFLPVFSESKLLQFWKLHIQINIIIVLSLLPC